MDLLKKIFPYAYVERGKDEFIKAIVIQVIAIVLSGVVFTILGLIPIVNIITGIIGGIIELYLIASIVFTVLSYLNILK